MLETKCFGDVFGHFDRQLYIIVEHQHLKDVINIEVSNITVTVTVSPLYVRFSKHRQHTTLNYHKGKIFHLYNAIECFCWNNNRQSTLQQCQSMRLPRKDLLLNIISTQDTWMSLSRQQRVCAASFLAFSLVFETIFLLLQKFSSWRIQHPTA